MCPYGSSERCVLTGAVGGVSSWGQREVCPRGSRLVEMLNSMWVGMSPGLYPVTHTHTHTTDVQAAG